MENKVNRSTVVAMCEIMDVKDVVKATGYAPATIYRLKKGHASLCISSDDLDNSFLESVGLRVCGCCEIRLVPTKPIRGWKLTRLCESCWTGDQVHDAIVMSKQ